MIKSTLNYDQIALCKYHIWLPDHSHQQLLDEGEIRPEEIRFGRMGDVIFGYVIQTICGTKLTRNNTITARHNITGIRDG